MKDIRYIIADNVRLYRRKLNTGRTCGTGRSVTGLYKTDWEWKKTMSLENFIRLLDALRVLLSLFLYDQVDKIPGVERIYCILRGRSEETKGIFVTIC